MRQLVLAVIFGLVFCTPMVISQTTGFSQQGKVTHELRDEGLSIAHSSLPLNSKVKIANMSTGKVVEGTITRLIPASSSRIADVSSGVWQELGLTQDTEVRIYTTAAAKPPTTASSTVTSPTVTVATSPAVTSPTVTAATSPTVTTTTSPAVTASSAAAAPRTAQAETYPTNNMPSNVKFENNFIVNGVPMGMSGPAYGTSQQTTQPAPAYEAWTQTTQPSPAYETRSQAIQPVPSVVTAPQTQPAVTYYETRPQQVQSAPVQSAPAYETRPQQAQPAAVQSATAYETRPQQTQSAPVYETRAQTAQPVPSVVTTQAQPAVTYYETRPQQAQSAPIQPIVVVNESWAQQPQPIVIYDAWPQPGGPYAEVRQQAAPPTDIWSQIIKPASAYETRTQTVLPVAPVETWSVTETETPMTWTRVIIDDPLQTAKPTIIIDNQQR